MFTELPEICENIVSTLIFSCQYYSLNLLIDSSHQLSPLFIGLATRVVDGTLAAGTSSKIVLDMASLFNAEFAAAAVLISFGAVLGKLSPTQVREFVDRYSFFPSF